MLLTRYEIMNHCKQRIILALVLVASFTLSACAPLIITGTVAGAGASIAGDRREAGQFLEDQYLEFKVTDAIYGDLELGKQVHVDVTVYNGTVLLTGEAPNTLLRGRIADLAETLTGVKEVYNEVRVAEVLKGEQRRHDAWLTSLIKAQLVAKRGLFTHTKVVTSNGRVYLLGLLTDEERAEAMEVTRNTNEVKDIIPLFQHYEMPVAVAGQKGPTGEEPAAQTQEAGEGEAVPFEVESSVQLSSDE